MVHVCDDGLCYIADMLIGKIQCGKRIIQHNSMAIFFCGFFFQYGLTSYAKANACICSLLTFLSPRFCMAIRFCLLDNTYQFVVFKKQLRILVTNIDSNNDKH